MHRSTTIPPRACILAVMLTAACVASPAAAQLFGPGDTFLAFDFDGAAQSSYPQNETPYDALDGDPYDTKYLNFGKLNTGVVFTINQSPGTARCISFWTANDFPTRDPASWELWGTHDPLMSADNSAGDAEDWTLIASATVDMPLDRRSPAPFLNFANSTAYRTYKVIFPTVRDPGAANSMQVAEIELYTEPDGGGTTLLPFVTEAVAVGAWRSDSGYDPAETPAMAFDNDPSTLYRNLGGENSGVIVQRADGASTIIESFTMTTGSYGSDLDPTEWALYGTNDTLTSPDNGSGDLENWTLIDTGSVSLPTDRGAVSDPIIVNGGTPYSAHRLAILGVVGGSSAEMQVAEITFSGQVVDETLVNVAASANGASATQSSTFDPSYSTADKANDGDRQGDYSTPPGIAHTLFEPMAWWEASFAGAERVSRVVIFNRTDGGLGPRIDPFTVALYSGVVPVWASAGNTFAADISGPGVAGMTFNFPEVTADRVRVQLDGTNYLQLAEVEVWAVSDDADPCPADLAPPGGDGAVNTNDFFQFLAYYQAMDPSADFSPPGGDGVINTNDFFAFLAAYQAGCP